MLAHQRQKRLVDLLSRRGQLTVGEIRSHFRASPATVRRDLAELAQRGAVVRTHGGVIHPASLQGEPVFQQRVRHALRAKKAIAAEAVHRLGDAVTVYIDSGTSALAVAQLLLPRRDLTLFTNSLPLLLAGRSDGARIVSPGGELRVPSQSLVGSLALTWMSHLRFDVAFIGASGLQAQDGASVTSLEEAAMKQAAMARARRVILVAGAAKWNSPAAVGVAPWSAFHLWVTDAALSRAERSAIEKQGVDVCMVKAGS